MVQLPVVTQPNRCSFNLPCSQAYSRLQALQILQRNENNLTDAEGNLHIVIQASQSRGIHLEEATEAFIRIQRIEGGSSKTSEARLTFNYIISNLHVGSLEELTNAYTSLRMQENSQPDALGNFQLVINLATQSRRIGVHEATEQFNTLLRIEGGNSKTQEARTAFSLISQSLHVAQLRELVNSYLALRRVENNQSDALGNFHLVMRATALCGSIQVATQDFNETLRMNGGSSATEAARSSYRMIYGI